MSEQRVPVIPLDPVGLNYMINNTNKPFKISLDDDIRSKISNICNNIIPPDGVVRIKTRMAWKLNSFGNGLYGSQKNSNIISSIEPLPYRWGGLDVFSQSPIFITRNCMDKDSIVKLMEIRDWSWTDATCKGSVFKELDDENVFDWKFGSLGKKGIHYSSKLHYQTSNAFSCLTVEPFELSKISLLLPGSAPKFVRVFPFDEQIKISQFISHFREWKCTNPLIHNTFLLDNERIAALKLKSFTTIQFPGEIMVFGPGSCVQSFAYAPTLTENCHVFTRGVVKSFMERPHCECPAFIKQLLGDEHEAVRLLSGVVEVMNKEALHGKSSDDKFQNLETKLNTALKDTSNVDEIIVIANPVTNEPDDANEEVAGESDDSKHDGKKKKQKRGLRKGKKIQHPADVINKLRKRTRDQRYYKNLSPESKKRRIEKNQKRERNCSEIAKIFKRQIEKAQKRICRIMTDLAAHADPSIQDKPARSVETLSAQRERDETIKEDLIKDRERYNILKHIYCKSRGTLKVNITVGLSPDEIIRLFFDFTSTSNQTIWNMAVDLAIDNEERATFYKNLIKRPNDWREYFNVRHGINIPWEKWISDLDESFEKADNIIETLQNGDMEETQSEVQDNEDENETEDLGMDTDDEESENNYFDNQSVQQLDEFEQSHTSSRVHTLESNNNHLMNETPKTQENHVSNTEQDIETSIQEALSFISGQFSISGANAIPGSNNIFDDDVLRDAFEDIDNEAASQNDSQMNNRHNHDQNDRLAADAENDTTKNSSNESDNEDELDCEPRERNYIKATLNLIKLDKNDGIDSVKPEWDCLNGSGNLNRQTVNDYFRLISTRSSENGSKMKTLTGTTSCTEYDYNDIRDYENIGDLLDYDYFMAPISMCDNYILFVVNFPSRTYYVYDPTIYARSQMRADIDSIMAFIQQIFIYHDKELDWTEYKQSLHYNGPYVSNASSTGVYACMFADQLASGKIQVEGFDETAARRRMLCELYTGKMYHKEMAQIRSQDIFS